MEPHVKKAVVELADDLADDTVVALRPGQGWVGAVMGWLAGSALGAALTAGLLVALKPDHDMAQLLLGAKGAGLIVATAWLGAVFGAQAGCLRVGFKSLISAVVGTSIAVGITVVIADEHAAVREHLTGLRQVDALPLSQLLEASWVGAAVALVAAWFVGAGFWAPTLTVVACLGGTLFASSAVGQGATVVDALLYSGVIAALFAGGGAQVGVTVRRAMGRDEA